MNQLTQEDLRNILALVNIAPIKGQEASTVAILQQKLIALLDKPKNDEKSMETTPNGDKAGK